MILLAHLLARRALPFWYRACQRRQVHRRLAGLARYFSGHHLNPSLRAVCCQSLTSTHPSLGDFPPDWHGPTDLGYSSPLPSSTSWIISLSSTSPAVSATMTMTSSAQIQHTTPSQTVTQSSPSTTLTAMSRSGNTLAATISGATAGGVALLLLAGILLCLFRRRRAGHAEADSSSLPNAVVQYPFFMPRMPNGSKHPGNNERDGRVDQTMRGNASDILDAQGTATAQAEATHESQNAAIGHSPMLDIAAASAMLCQLEGFMRSVNVGRR